MEYDANGVLISKWDWDYDWQNWEELQLDNFRGWDWHEDEAGDWYWNESKLVWEWHDAGTLLDAKYPGLRSDGRDW